MLLMSGCIGIILSNVLAYNAFTFTCCTFADACDACKCALGDLKCDLFSSPEKVQVTFTNDKKLIDMSPAMIGVSCLCLFSLPLLLMLMLPLVLLLQLPVLSQVLVVTCCCCCCAAAAAADIRSGDSTQVYRVIFYIE